MIRINLLFKLAWLISGDFDGERITKNIFQQFLQLFGIFLSLLECLIAFVIIFKPNLKHHLIVLHLTDSEISQLLFTMCTGFVHFGFVVNRIYFFRFNSKPEKLKFLSYLFCKDEQELAIRYKVDKIAAKKIADMISIEKFGIIWIMQYLVTNGYFIFIQCLIIRCLYLAYLNTFDTNGITIFEFIFISIPFSLILDLAFYTESLSVVASYLTFITNCKFITYNLEDLCRRLESLIKYQTGNRNDNRDDRSVKMKIKIYKILRKMNSILRFHDSTQYLANKSIAEFYLCVLLIALFFPYMILFDKNSILYQIILFLIYFVTISCTSYTIVWANSLVFKKFDEFRNLKSIFLRYSDNTEVNLKLLNSIEKSPDSLNLNCFKLFKYTKIFLLDWILNSITMIFLLYSTKNVYGSFKIFKNN